MPSPATGRIILAASPIGNPADATARLSLLLATADVVAAEDTRRLRALAGRLDVAIGGALISLHEHNEPARIGELIERAEQGQTVVVVSDAGMPTVSDPGFALVRAAAQAGVTVSVAPGPSAVLAALAVSGLPTDRFTFEGFLPRKVGELATRLAELATERRTMVMFVAARRLAQTLTALSEAFGGERPAAVCRELTKTHEEVRRGPLIELSDWAADGEVLGEVVVVVGGADRRPVEPADLLTAVQALIEAGQPLSQAVAEVAAQAGTSRRRLYQAVLASRPPAGGPAR